MNLQNTIAQSLPDIKSLAEQYGYEKQFEQAAQAHNHFKLRLPFIGAFSAGKSKLINTLLEEKLLSVEVDPETCLPTELFYSEHESIRICSDLGDVSELSREQLKNQDYLLSLQQKGREYWIEIGLPNQILSKNKELVIVDMPGWDSGIVDHNLAIDNYVQRSGAYCLVINASEGTVRGSIQQSLTELKLFNKPIVLVISKIDKINQDEQPAVIDNITSKVTDLLGTPPVAVVTTSARKKRLEGLPEALDQVVTRSNDIYRRMVLGHFDALFNRIVSKANVLLNEDNLNVEQAQQAYDEIPTQLATLKTQLEGVEAQIEELIPSCVESVKTNLSNNLKTQLGSLSACVMSGSCIQSQVLNALRRSYLTTIEQDFKPKVTRQLKSLQNLNDIAPTHIKLDSTFTPSETQKDSLMVSQVISLVLTKVITLIPALKPFTPLIYAITSLFSSKQDEAIQREQQLEQVKQYVLNELIPQILAQVKPSIESCLNDMVAKVKAEIAEEYERKAADKQQALIQLKSALSNVVALDEQQKLAYKQAVQQIEDIQKQLLHN